LVNDLVDVLPRGHADRAGPLTRAAESVVGNLAEGAGRWSEADSANRYKIARAEAMECAASLDVMKLQGHHPRNVAPSCSKVSLKMI
jgi:four helix bundle protein